ncbi:hypothetical protein H6G81_33290 [Scytonema hofmannii FACHB-248]|uniref:Uncharacterized protein n=1 Tax=Scytonema hofmannii FACHB-248 TaxID=1842502 RepID=A0ABR8H0B1_9CYAN|nr:MULTISPECIES: hypothetical protein [Nostocales]MBD2609251.1 hypothetical protein [Scytonema hofmannii FACHB-248]
MGNGHWATGNGYARIKQVQDRSCVNKYDSFHAPCPMPNAPCPIPQ